MINKQTGMMLFIKGFPTTLNSYDLKSFLRHLISRAKREGDSVNGSVRSCRIVRTTNAEIQGVERYALVELKPARLALWCIKKIQGTQLAGVEIVARRYRQRSLLCERRQPRQEPKNIHERRVCDRRREGFRIEDVESPTPKILVRMIR